jgi:hypothetical protein
MALILRNLEINVTEHCNLRCKGCDHASPVLEKRFIDAGLLTRWLEPLRSARIGRLKFIGGEPTLHPRLLALIGVAREMGIADEIGVVTNGTMLHRMETAFWESIDFLQVTFYPGVRVRLTREKLAAKASAHGFRLTLTERNLFRYTVLREAIEDPKMVQRIYDRCELPRALGCHTLRDGRLFKCSPAAFSKDRLGLAAHDDGGLELSAVTNLEEEVTAYLDDPRPLEACRYCLGTCGKDFAVVQERTAGHAEPWAVLIDEARLAGLDA